MHRVPVPAYHREVHRSAHPEPVPALLSRTTQRLNAAVPADITRAAALLRAGGTVAFPTETVYGLGASALNPSALENIFRAKQRPHWDPLIVHVSSTEMLDQVVDAIDPVSLELIERFWPGPLTLLLPRSRLIPDLVTAGRPLVGVRMPRHPIALELIRQAGVPIAAPSANRFGHTSPTTAIHVLADLEGRIDAILDGGPCSVGVESTVAEVAGDRITVYRPGGISLASLAATPGVQVASMYEPPPNPAEAESLPSPGVSLRHYAPQARLVLVSPDPAGLERSLLLPIQHATTPGQSVAALVPDGWLTPPGCPCFPWGPWSDGETLARCLYDGLRTLDDAGATVIVCPMPEMSGIGEAIRDRLRKAAAP